MPSTSRTDHIQGYCPKLVVAEVVGEPLITDDASTPQLVEVVDERWLRGPGGRDQQADREGPTDDRRHLDQAPSAVGKLAESGAQDRPYRRRERRLAFLRRDPGSKHFD